MPHLFPFPHPTLIGKFERRYKRFFAEITLDSKKSVIAHCPNTGSLKSCLIPGAQALLTHNPDPKRKLHYTLEALKPGKAWVGVNTHLPNHLVRFWIENAFIEEFKNPLQIQSEVPYGDKSRIDFVVTTQKNEHPIEHYIEIKNVTYQLNEKVAAFPDSVTTRGQKHLDELIQLAKLKNKAAWMVFLVNRPDCATFQAASDIDPVYAKKLSLAKKKGVRILILQSKISLSGIHFAGRIPDEI